MTLWLILLVAACESVGVGLVGAVALRLLRRNPVGHSLVAIIVTTVCAMNASVITVVLVMRSAALSISANLLVNFVAGAVSLGIGLLLGRSVTRGSRQLADATRSLGTAQRFRAPEDPPSAELAELARELRITSDKLAESRRREQAAEQSRRQLMAWISHDLRSPLARLRALAESVEDGVVADSQEYRTKVRADTERLATMVDDLFQLSQLRAGTLSLQPRKVGLDDLVSDEVGRLDVLAAGKKIRLCAGVVEPVTVDVDERYLPRVINNLLVNAIRYSPEETTVRVDVRAVHGWAVVSVVDECGGIPPQALGFVFKMGWRDHRRRSGGGGGGFGLAIVQGLVRAHHGHVSVHNVPGGCCFEVRLPLAL